MTGPARPQPRDHILSLAPYKLAPGGPAGRRLIRLDQNENAAAPSPAAVEAARAALRRLNRYPEGDARSLREAIAEAEGLPAERILCGNGSMELLGLIAQAYLGPGDEALMSQYGYLYFRTAAAASGARVVLAPERGFRAQVDALLGRVGPRTRVLFLANPNNPTGSLLGRREIERLRAGLSDDILLVIDAAYAEYVREGDYEPGAALVEAAPNTVMLRSFSKIHGLAGLRVGWAYAPASLAEVLNRIRHPNNVNAVGMAAAAAAIRERGHIAGRREANAAARERLANGLAALGFAPPPSHGNFVLIPFVGEAAAAAAYAHLAREGILLRGMAGYGLGDCLRATVGTPEEIDATLGALKTWRAAAGAPVP